MHFAFRITPKADRDGTRLQNDLTLLGHEELAGINDLIAHRSIDRKRTDRFEERRLVSLSEHVHVGIELRLLLCPVVRINPSLANGGAHGLRVEARCLRLLIDELDVFADALLLFVETLNALDKAAQEISGIAPSPRLPRRHIQSPFHRARRAPG